MKFTIPSHCCEKRIPKHGDENGLQGFYGNVEVIRGEKRIPKHGDENKGAIGPFQGCDALVKKESPNMRTRKFKILFLLFFAGWLSACHHVIIKLDKHIHSHQFCCEVVQWLID